MDLSVQSQSPEIVSIVLALRPQQATRLPASLGRAAESLLLDWVEEVDPELSEFLHSDLRVKPFTCSSLMGARRVSNRQILVDTQQVYTLRYTILSPDLTSIMLKILDNYDLSKPVELDYRSFTLERWTTNSQEDPWRAKQLMKTYPLAIYLDRRNFPPI